MRAHLTTTLEIAGLAAITGGFALVSPVLGLIVGGSALVLIGWRLA